MNQFLARLKMLRQRPVLVTAVVVALWGLASADWLWFLLALTKVRGCS